VEGLWKAPVPIPQRHPPHTVPGGPVEADAAGAALRGPCGAQFEFALSAIAQNLRRLAKLVARPPPLPAPCAA
jgi:hypothetical protein